MQINIDDNGALILALGGLLVVAMVFFPDATASLWDSLMGAVS